MSKKHIFSIGDIVTYQDSKLGEVIHVGVDEDNNTFYLVDFKNSCGKFLAKDLEFIK